MSKTENVINQLAIELANKTVNGAYDKAERDEALAELQQVKNERDEALADLKNINEILQSDEQLKNLYEEVKARQIEKG
jgi:hypothetical protein